MKKSLAAIVAVCAVWLVSGQEQAQMTPVDIDAAIRLGQNQKRLSPYKLESRGTWQWATPVAMLTTPYLRVALAAQEAKRLYKPFPAADVPPELLEPLVQIIVPPFRLHGTIATAPYSQPERVIVLPKGKTDPSDAIEPIWQRQYDHTMQNWFGATFSTQSLVAAFNRSDLADGNVIVMIFNGPAPGGSVASRSSEARVTIRAKDVAEWR